MVRHWWSRQDNGWITSAAINGIGATVTAIVLVVVGVTKTAEGAWVVLVLIPLHVVMFRSVHRHYRHVAEQLSLNNWTPSRRHNVVIVPVSGVHRAVVQAVEYAKTLSPDVRAVYINLEAGARDAVVRSWDRWGQGVPLITLSSPYRSLVEPLLEYIEEVGASRPDAFVTVVLPEFVPARWWQHLFHNQRALLIKGALLFKPNVVLTNVPFHLSR
jgi:hypothetical protein